MSENLAVLCNKNSSLEANASSQNGQAERKNNNILNIDPEVCSGSTPVQLRSNSDNSKLTERPKLANSNGEAASCTEEGIEPYSMSVELDTSVNMVKEKPKHIVTDRVSDHCFNG